MFRYLWPSRQEWSASLLESPIPLKGYKTTNWRTDRPIKAEDSFVLDIRKPNGRGRVIDKISFMQNGYSSAEHPKQVAIILQGKCILYDEKLDIAQGHNINVKLQHPEKVKFIVINIIEPFPNRYWAVGDIRIREVRLFGRFWRVNIR